jgi:hypothetical protein
MQESFDVNSPGEEAFDLGIGGRKTSFDDAVRSKTDGASDIALDGPLYNDRVRGNASPLKVTWAPT